MSKVQFKARAMEFKNGFLFLPATQADKTVVNTFCQTVGNKFINITAATTNSNKTFDQVKTVFALVDIMFESQEGRKPTSQEQDSLYRELLEEFGEREPCIRNPEKTMPVTLSRMSKIQAMKFIDSIIHELAESCDLNNKQQIDVKEIFEEYQKERSTDIQDPIDYDENGNLLSVSEWAKRNNMSFATGLTKNLDIAHIVTRGAAPQYKNCCWNFLRLTHEEHMMQHQIGWNEFLQLYPHLRPRVTKAIAMAGNINKLLPDDDDIEEDTSVESIVNQILDIKAEANPLEKAPLLKIPTDLKPVEEPVQEKNPIPEQVNILLSTFNGTLVEKKDDPDTFDIF